MLTRHHTILSTILRTIKIPDNINCSVVPFVTTKSFTSVTIEILEYKFTIFMTNNNSQVNVYSDNICTTLAIESIQWDSVVIGQVLGNAIQQWIDTKLGNQFIYMGCYGFKIKSIRRVNSFIFLNTDYYDQNHNLHGSKASIHSVNDYLGSNAITLIDLFGDRVSFDPSSIPTMNMINPKHCAVLLQYQGFQEELQELVIHEMNKNLSKIPK